MARITIKKIAQELGISIGTVDRAIHNRYGVNEKTRKKVLDYIKKHNYSTDKAGRSLAMKSKSIKIGVITRKNPEFFWNKVIKGIKNAKNNYSDFGLEVVLRQVTESNSTKETEKYIDQMAKTGIKGLVITPIISGIIKKRINNLTEQGIAVCTMNDDITGTKRLFYIGPQFEQSGRLAAEVTGGLMGGKGNIIIVFGNLNSYEYQKRFEGFHKKIKEFNGINIINENDSKTKSSTLIQNTDMKILFKQYKGRFNAIYDVDGASLSNTGYAAYNELDYKNIVIVGHEINGDVSNLMDKGVINAVVSQDAYSQGYYSVVKLYEYLMYKKIPDSEYIYSRLDLIMKESLQNQNKMINPYF